MKDYQDFVDRMRRQAEADDALAIVLGRDFISFGRWLNAAAITATPIVVHILKLEDTTAAKALAWPLIFFAAGLCCSALSTGLGFLALGARASRSLSQSDAVAHRITVHEAQAASGHPDPEWKRAIEARIAEMERDEAAAQRSFTRFRWAVIGLAFASVASFGAGVFKGGYGFLQ